MNYNIDLKCELSEPCQPISFQEAFQIGDSKAHVFNVHVEQNGNPVDIINGSVNAFFQTENNASPYSVSGTVNGNIASVTVPTDVYATSGNVVGIIRVVNGSINSTTIAKVHFWVDADVNANSWIPSNNTWTVASVESYLTRLKDYVDGITNLAYLGMKAGITDSTIDLNSYRGVGKEGVYNIGASATPLNAPDGTGARTLIVLSQLSSSVTRQILINFATYKFHMRMFSSNKWYDWKDATEDLSTLIGTAQSTANSAISAINDLHALAMNAPINSSDTDLNTYRGIGKEGVYNIGSSVTPANAPDIGGNRTLIVTTQAGSSVTRQMLVNYSANKIHMRIFTSNVWSTWVEFAANNTDAVLASTLGRNGARKAIDHGGIWSEKYENSPKAFIESAKLGIYYHNVDIVFSYDHVPFVAHDDSMTDAETGTVFKFSTLTAEGIKGHKIGDSDYSWTPMTLAEFCRFIQAIGGCIHMVDISNAANETDASKVANARALAQYYRSNNIRVDWTNFDDDNSRNAFIDNAPSYGVYLVCNGSSGVEAKLNSHINYIRSKPNTKFCINTSLSSVKAFINNYLATLNDLGVILYTGVYTNTGFINNNDIYWADGILSERHNVNYEDYKNYIN